MPIKLTTTMGRGRGEEKSSKESTEQNLQKIRLNNKSFSCVTAVRVLSHAGNHSPPHLPRMPSNTELISGPAVGAVQILIWSYSYVFLPPMSTAIRTWTFCFVGALNDLSYIPSTESA